MLVILLVAALAVRLYRLEAQSLWYDEGTSAALAGRALGDILRAAANDIHPPLYYLLLAAWTRLGGGSDFALRALSAALGTLVVAATAGVARRLWNGPQVLVAAWLAAISPLLVWYSQEVRMYAMAAALAALLVMLAMDLAAAACRGRAPRAVRRRWLAYVALASAALYTQYLVGASAILAANLAAVAWMGLSRRAQRLPTRRQALAWAAAQVLPVASLGIWLPFAWPALRDWPSVGAHTSMAALWRSTLQVLALGPRVPPAALAGLGLVAGAAGLGLATAILPRQRRAAAVAGAYAAAAPLLLSILYFTRPAWDAKFLTASAPGFELLAAAGALAPWAALGAVRRRTTLRFAGPKYVAAAVGAALVLGVTWPRAVTLWSDSHDPAYQRDDYRGIAALVAAQAGPKDAVILDAPTQIEVYGRYHKAPLPVFLLPVGRRPPPADTQGRLAAIAGGHRDLYAVLWATDEADPDGVVEGWLDRNRYKVSDTWHGNVRLCVWAAARRPVESALAPGAAPVPFGHDQMALAALWTGPLALAAGDVVTMDAVWTAAGTSPPTADYRVFLHLLDAAGRIVAQRDMAPVGGTERTSSWTPAPLQSPGAAGGRGAAQGSAGHLDRMGLAVPAGTPAGTYTLTVGLYDPVTGERLPASGPGRETADPGALAVGTVTVLP